MTSVYVTLHSTSNIITPNTPALESYPMDGSFVYGLPELHRDAIKKARYVASPGCFATSIELALLPLARAAFCGARSRCRRHHGFVR